MIEIPVPTIEQRVKQALEVLGASNKCLGGDWAIDFKEEELHTFLSSLKPEVVTSLGKLLIFFKINMGSISPLLVQGKRTSRTMPELLAEMAWSNIAIAVMFSIVDDCTKKRHHQHRSTEDFVAFLKRRFNEIKTPEALEVLSAEHRKLNPPSMSARLLEFYSTHLTPNEVDSMVRQYRSSEREKVTINDLDDVIKDLYEKIRSSFVHAASLESINISSVIFKSNLYDVPDDGKETPLVIQIHTNLTPSEILFLSWKAIFRSLGYTGSLTKVSRVNSRKNRL